MRWISLNPEFRGCAKVMRDGAKSRFVALFSARMTASAINSQKLPPRLVVPADWAHSQYGFTFVPRDFEVDCFVRRSRIPHQVFESFRDRRRGRGKVEKNTSVSQIHLRRNVQPEERIVRLGSGELQEPML